MNTQSPSQTTEATSPTQTALRRLLGAVLLFSGTSHLLWARREFRAQVPRALPLPTERVVVLSGFAELALGGALIGLSRYRTIVGWIVAAFFVAIFPGNIAQYRHRRRAFGLNSDTARAVRLLFQPVLVVWALWATGAWQVGRTRRQTPGA